MKKILKTVCLYAFLLLIPLLFFELAAGYYLLQSSGTYEPAGYRLLRSFKHTFERAKADALAQNQSEPDSQPDGVFAPDNRNNPFIMNAPDDVQVRFHPLLNYSYAAIATNTPGLSDFFGFRNNTNLYFTERHKDEMLILMSGGSECLGFTHPKETIIENLKGKLQAHTKKRVQILNLCMNSYTLAYEIQAYVMLGYPLKPDLVITHSGWNDIMYGLLISQEFVRVGMNYNKWQEAWLEKLYGNVKWPAPADVFSRINRNTKEIQIAGYWGQIKKYHDIATANGAKFLVGLQSYNPDIANDTMAPAHRQTHAILKTMYPHVPAGYDFIDFTRYKRIRYADSVHTTQDSVDIIGDIYADFILKIYPEFFRN